MIRAIIIDDEEDGRIALQNMLERHCPSIELIATANNAAAGKTAIDEHQVDLIFLDVEMPGGSGFDMLRSLGERNFDIIFTTAFDEYAIQAFQYSATHYLLKPIDPDELKEAVERVLVKVEEAHAQEAIDVLLENLNQPTNGLRKLALPTSNGTLFILLKQIIHIESDNNYTTFYFEDEKPVVASKSIKEMEELLLEHDFFRVHNSHLINLEHIKEYSRLDGGTVILSNGVEVMVSRRKKEDFLVKLKELGI